MTVPSKLQTSTTDEVGKGNVHSLRKFTACVCGNEVRALPSVRTVAQLIEYSKCARVQATEAEPDDSQPRGFHPIKWKWSIPSWGACSGEDWGCGRKIVRGEWFSNYTDSREREGLPRAAVRAVATITLPEELFTNFSSEHVYDGTQGLCDM